VAMSHQAFETNVGLPRLLTLLSSYSISATFFVPGFVADREPDMVRAVVDAGHEVAHHSYSHRRPTELSDDEDRREFEAGLTALDRCGVRPAGYRAPMWSAAWRTPDLVSEFGMIYDSSFMDDDKPYVLSTCSGDIAEVPPHWSLDDWEQYAYLPEPHLGYHINDPTAVCSMWLAELDAMRRHRAAFVLTGHGFLSGRAGRVEGLRALIEGALGFGDVEFKTAEQTAREALSRKGTVRRSHQPVNVDPAVFPVF